MLEIWKKIIGYEGLYEVSNLGRIRSLEYQGKKRKEPLVMNPYKNKKSGGYLQVDLYKNGERKTKLVHILVWNTFIGDIPDGMQINHKDENTYNNALSNLEICTPTYNVNYGSRTKRAVEKMKGRCFTKKAIVLRGVKDASIYRFDDLSSCSYFFGYKSFSSISTKIIRAQKKGERTIKINKVEFYYSVSDYCGNK